jgi:membrane protein
MASDEKAKKQGNRFPGWLHHKLWPAVWSRAKRYGRIFYFAGKEFRRDHCVIRSAALSFVLLLSLVPVTFVFFIILNAVGAFRKFGHSLRDTLADQVVPKAEQFDSVREWLNTTTDRLVSQVSGDITHISFNLLSFGAMIITAGLLLTAIEKSMNDIWVVRVKRGIFKRFGNIWAIITLGPVIIFFLFYFGFMFYTRMSHQPASGGWLYDSFLSVLPYIGSILAFYLMFQLVPFTRIRADAALFGAVFTGIVWEFSKVPFTAYVSNVINPTGVYGPLGVIPFFLLWVYLSWAITLFGTELSYCKQNFDMMSSAHKHDEHFLSVYKGYYTVRILGEAVLSFQEGKGAIKASRVAKKLQVPLNWCRELAEGLRENELLNYAGHDRTRFQLAKPPDKITLKEALAKMTATQLAVPGNANTVQDRILREVFDAINTHREEALSSVTFADIIGEG